MFDEVSQHASHSHPQAMGIQGWVVRQAGRRAGMVAAGGMRRQVVVGDHNRGAFAPACVVFRRPPCSPDCSTRPEENLLIHQTHQLRVVVRCGVVVGGSGWKSICRNTGYATMICHEKKI